MRKTLLLSLTFLCFFYAKSQVGVGTDLPNSSAQLDIQAKDKGILIPRVNLESITDQQTISSGNVQSLLVFNTNNNAEVVPGYYYWYDGEWRRFLISGEYLPETITSVSNNSDGTFTYINEEGIEVTFDANTTSFINNNDGTYTFTNDNGESLTVDIINEVATDIQNQGDVYNEIINLLEANSDVLVDNGDGTFTHTAVDGTQLTFDANTVSYTNNNDGSYTFTNDNGESLTVDIINEVATDIQNQGDVYNEIINLLEANSDVLVDNGDGTFTHTA
ncbi:MAG: hypothetical protein CMC87_00005, partial [Flavobacteriaceae bacterium]|nr:hypothetical protein [Flavobacteriaceae bacterium]